MKQIFKRQKVHQLVTIRLAMATVVAVASPAEASISLVCDGEVLQTTDWTEHRRIPSRVEIEVDIDTSTISARGFWGCSDMICLGKKQAEISKDYISYSYEFEGPMSASGGYKINRKTGIMSSDVYRTAKPDSGAKWRAITMDGKFKCEVYKENMF